MNGPPAHDPDTLLAHAAWMRRFATALAGAEGEDLAQDAWVRLLARPLPALERPRAWLASALRNAARSRARGETRRARREAEHAPSPEELSGADLVVRTELEQLAVQSVLALAEPYRETLLLRYLRGLEPAEIARRQGVPASTVRNRIARGLELVRARLDARHGGRREAWLALIVPFERGLAGGTGLGGTAAAGLAAGGALMTAKWVVGGALAAVLAVLWWSRNAGERSEGRPVDEAHGSAAALLAPDTDEPAVPVAPAPTGDARTPLGGEGAASEPLSATAGLEVRVSFARDGSPAAGSTVEVTSWDAPLHPRRCTGIADGEGRVAFLGLEPGRQIVEERRSDGDWIEVAAGETRAYELVIPPGVDVDVRVVDAEGLPVARAEVWLSDYANSTDGGVIGRTGADGRLFVRDVGESRSLAARADGHVPSAQRDVIGNAGDRIALTLELRGPGAALAGVVRAPDGTPVAGAEVLVGFEGTSSLSMPNGEVLTTPPPLWLACDEQGRFEARGLEPVGTWVQARAPGLAPLMTQVALVAGETTRAELTLALANRVQGVVRDGAGQPLADVTLSSGRYLDFDYVRTLSAADGSYVLEGLRVGANPLLASSEEHGTERAKREFQGAGETKEWFPVLEAGPTLAGVVLDERGAPLAGWHVAAVERTHLGLWLRSDETDAEGRFRLVNCPTVPFVLAVRSPLDPWGEPVALVEEFQFGQTDLVVRVPDDAHPTAFVSGRLRASDGRALEQAEVRYRAEGARWGGRSLIPDAQGRFRIGPLRAGRYALEVSAAGLGTLHRRGLVLAPGQELELGELTLEPASQIVLRARVASGAGSPQGTQTQLFLADERVGHIEILQDGVGRSQALGPGRYVLRTRAWSWYAPDVELDLAPGETRELELVLQPATQRGFLFVPPAGDGAERLRLVVRDAQERTVCDVEGVTRLQDGRFGVHVSGLLSGLYTFEARTDTGRAASGSFEVLDLSFPSETLEILLR